MSAPNAFHRDKRRKLAMTTFEEILYGTYFTKDGTEIAELGHLIKKSKRLSKILTVGDIYETKLQMFDELTSGCQFHVNFPLMTTVEAIEYYHVDERTLIQVLNFASARTPGGGWLNGAEAQEESLMRSSGLFDCLDQFDDTYYSFPKRKGIYSNTVIVSPQVPFFKNDKGEPSNSPILCDVVTCAAVNCMEFQPKTKASRKLIKQITKLRIEMILDAFDAMAFQHITKNENDFNQRVVVLGAWGCGVFRNPIKQVSRLFCKVMNERQTFNRLSTTFVFAIPDQSTMTKFCDSFKAKDSISSSNHKH